MPEDKCSKPSFYAVIPAVVRYDTTLTPNAKLIYAELSALASDRGYCWASNRAIANNYGFSKKTVSSLIGDLADRGYISIDVKRAHSGEVEMRKIWINASFAHAHTPMENLGDTPMEDLEDTSPESEGEGYPVKKGYPIPQIVKENNTSINNNPPTPQGGAHGDAHFDEFWNAYPHKVDKQRAQKAFKRLKVDDELLQVMLSALDLQKRSPQWVKDGGAYIPYPTTWLNNRRWEIQTDAVLPQGRSTVIESEEVPEWR